MVGEMRDTETMSLALTAAETGHLVIGTLHTGSAAATISRVVNLFPASEQSQAVASFSESLVGIISQRLLVNAEGTAMVPAFEILVNSLAMANTIRDGEHAQNTLAHCHRAFSRHAVDGSFFKVAFGRQEDHPNPARRDSVGGILMATIDELFKTMVERKASDLHLTIGNPPLIRVRGDFSPLMTGSSPNR